MKSLIRSLLRTCIFFIVLLSFSCKDSRQHNSPDNKPVVFDKLVGTWQNDAEVSFERWTRQPDGSYISVVFSIKGADTSWNERAIIYSESDHWIFENAVKDQNSGSSVKFKSSILTDNSVQFSNPEHDFPTDINYTIINSDKVHAFIIGPNGHGTKDTVPFNYTRVK